MKSNTLTTIVIFLLFIQSLSAGEGMWLPHLLGQLNEKEMRDMGMKITAEDIYSINHSSLKDAIVLFGGGCTAEVVSDKGLIFTNHHCGYGNIQRHSSLEHDYLSQGFWASSLAEELPNPGLSVTFLISIQEVTDGVLKGVTANMTETDRQSLIAKNAEKLSAEAMKGSHYKALVKSFYEGNQYYLFLTETFTDVRLVGAPPSNIGKFGGDTDNWMWPRHTGDFSVFRIYAGKDNKPADYSKENIPFTPRKHLTISTKGVKEGDFTFVYGFPGTTEEYLPSYAVDLTVNLRNPLAIKLRQERLSIIDQAMESDPLVRIQYSAKAAGIANYWKKMIGESRGIHKLDGIEKKQQFENGFTQWVEADPARKSSYGTLLPYYRQVITTNQPFQKAQTLISEGALATEIIRYSYGFNNLVKICDDKTKTDEDIKKAVDKLNAGIEGFFKNYYAPADEKIFAATMKICLAESNPDFEPESFNTGRQKFQGDTRLWAREIFSQSLFADKAKVAALLKDFSRKDSRKIKKDPAFSLATSLYAFIQQQLVPRMTEYYDKTDSLQRVYMKAQMEMLPDHRFYPDANSTMRVTYGTVKGYSPQDAVKYHWFTTLDGIMEKENPEVYDYVVEPKLKDLYEKKDFGPYVDSDGHMHVAFIATNHTTGGNSGSPVLNAYGELVGINFDRCWEGTMSDLMYDPDQCRNISLDIRYCLFIIDRFAGASHIIKELNISSL